MGLKTNTQSPEWGGTSLNCRKLKTNYDTNTKPNKSSNYQFNPNTESYNPNDIYEINNIYTRKKYICNILCNDSSCTKVKRLHIDKKITQDNSKPEELRVNKSHTGTNNIRMKRNNIIKKIGTFLKWCRKESDTNKRKKPIEITVTQNKKQKTIQQETLHQFREKINKMQTNNQKNKNPTAIKKI